MEKVVVIGAGPCGLSAAVELKRIGFHPLVIEKHNVVHSIYRYPTYMKFFSTPDLLEIGGIPFTTPNDKPTRLEALHYYRTVAMREELRIRCYEEAVRIGRVETGFVVETVDRTGVHRSYAAENVVVATGYFDSPNLLGIPGEDLPNVTHYYKEAHPYSFMRVAVIGGNNSAVDAALDLLQVGARVTMIYRGTPETQNVKPWVRPLFESMVRKGKIEMMYRSRVTAIFPDRIDVVLEDGSTRTIEIDFVLALTGFRPDRTMLKEVGVMVDDETGIPAYDPETMETNVPGLYVAGVVAAGRNANEIFIENGRFHGVKIAAHLAAKTAGAYQR
ncbi:MAG: hypothetical protein BLM47_09685 [Candidatus Reconcilbacillus cellulovorans]|uniref:Uncharacterized protein n=1 Tax=Candidatus Reconcilbacillus cellulovorans TaxID=1906605 RepID=A0A2A6DY34_9BACL|nr:MAG: hypothetical protein BLM47_09685 [Candidatus Reconcilbacillus cellulovorans]